MPGEPKSNVGTIAAVLGGLAALGGVAAVAFSGNKKPKLSGPRFGRPIVKKPCGCGR